VNVLIGSYNFPIAILSALIAILASWASFDLADRTTAARGVVRLMWLNGGAIAMGVGIWSMHYTAMLAFRLPVLVLYHWPTVLLSLLVSIVASAAALFVASRTQIGWPASYAGSLLQGAGIAGTHYIAMDSMRLPAIMRYSPPIVVLSIVVAVGGSLLSLRLAFFFRTRAAGTRGRKTTGALLMGGAICLMHYTGMAAVTFIAFPRVFDESHVVQVTLLGTAGIIGVTAMELAVALLGSVADRLRERNALLDALFEQAPQAVALMSVDNCVVRVNHEFTRVFGYTPEETLGRPLADLIVPPDLKDESERRTSLVAQGQRIDGEAVRQRKDGTRLDVLMVSVPISLPGGQTAICTMYRDITEDKAVERALQTLSNRLLEVQEAERRHLARELHDEIGQLLTGLRLLLRTNGDAGPEAYRSRFEQARALVDDLIGRIRGLSFDLRPADLDQLGLLPALLALFERYTSQTGVLVNFRHQGLETRFPPRLETAAYRIVQEALTNVARHAGVAGVTVRVWAEKLTLSLQIADRGCGFDADVVLKSPRSSGLPGMRERIMMLNGKMNVESSPGRGTVITAELPLVEND
jgi:PAS domain S-box-containing protein